ncbi:MAG: hypothetical protein J6J45_06240 [Clostridia bacterium]|nr:hypothetical protein [Clostridia bacterium]
MKLYYIFTAESGFDLTQIIDYKFAGSVKLGYVLIKFNESDIDNVIELYDEYLKKSIYLNYKINGYMFFGSDGGLYKYSDGDFVKVSSQGRRILISIAYLSFSRNRYFIKTLKDTKKFSLKFNDSVVLKKFSVLSFKSYDFYCREQNISFNFRLKKSSSTDKPLMIYMAGGASLGHDNIKQLVECNKLLHRQLKRHDCNILIPQEPCASYTYKPDRNDYYNAVLQLVDLICDEVKADRNRIYLVGSSGGGVATWEMIYRSPDLFACGISVMGRFIFDKNIIDFERFLNTPLWVAHSSDDNNVVIDSDDYCVEELKKIGADVRYTRWNNYGHRMNKKFFRNEPWAEWMFSQVKQ